MSKNELIRLFVLGHRLGLQSQVLLAVLKAHRVEVRSCTLGEAIGCLAEHVAFVPRSSTLVQDVVDLFEKLGG